MVYLIIIYIGLILLQAQAQEFIDGNLQMGNNLTSNILPNLLYPTPPYPTPPYPTTPYSIPPYLTDNTKLQECSQNAPNYIENNQNDDVVWESVLGTNLYFRRPHCLDETGVYILRECDAYIQEPCHKIQANISLCPDGFNQTETGCVMFKMTQFDAWKCPYGYEKAFTDVAHLYPDSRLWFPAKRSDYLGQFIYTELTTNYGSPVNLSLKNHTEHNCVTSIGGQLLPTSCDDSFFKMCAYDFLHYNYNSYCSRLSDENKLCIDAHFSQEGSPLCICTKSNEEVCYSAALNYTYQNSIAELEQGCSLELKITDTIFWASSKRRVGYTYWSYENISLTHLPVTTLYRDGWQFSNQASCQICEDKYIAPHPNVTIQFDAIKKALVVKIKNPESFVTFSNEEFLFCFTDAKKDALDSVFTKISRLDMVYELFIADSGHYSCEGFSINRFQKVISNTQLIVLHNIYVIEILIKYENEDPTSGYTAYNKYIANIELIYNNFSAYEPKIDLKWMKTLSVNDTLSEVNYLVHVCTNKSNDHMADFHMVRQHLNETFRRIGGRILGSSELISSEFCMPEEKLIDGRILNWNITRSRTSTPSNELCLDHTGERIVRKCLWTFLHGAVWGSVEKCYAYGNSSSAHTQDLLNLYNTSLTPSEIAGELEVITENSVEFEPIDILLSAKLLEKSNGDNVSLVKITNIISNIMSSKSTTLQTSQFEMQATDKILRTHDAIIDRNKILHVDEIITSKELVTFIFDPKHNKYRGIAFVNGAPVKLTLNMTLQQAVQIPNLEVASYIPDDVINMAKSVDNARIAINIYLKSSLFNDIKKPKLELKTFGILLPKLKPPNEAVTLIFKTDTRNHTICSFWYFNDNGGKWLQEMTSNVIDDKNNTLRLCNFDHVTHFGLLISDKLIVIKPIILEVITAIECALSVTGILGIYLTVILFRSWRRIRGNKLLVQFGTIYLLQIIMMYVSSTVKDMKSNVPCIIVGTILHYTVLAQFCWMLLTAYLQYQRYVLIFYGANDSLLRKFIWAMYLLPTLPVNILLIVSSENYHLSDMHICYPTGLGLQFAVILPICCMLMINFLMFVRIFVELFKKRETSQCCTANENIVLKLRLVIFLFFILGISWIFGILAELFESSILLYMFSMTVSIQGFIMFVFFILLNENVRFLYSQLWNKYMY